MMPFILQLECAYDQTEHIIREDNDLVTTVLMVFDEVLASLELLRVHAVKKHPLPVVLPQIFRIELSWHRTPDLSALKEESVIESLIRTETKLYLDISDMALSSQVHPVCLEKFRANHIVQIRNPVVFSYKGGSEAKLGVSLDSCDDFPEHSGRDYVHLIKQDKTPFAAREEVHHFLGVMRSVTGVRDHGIGRDDDTTLACKLGGVRLRVTRPSVANIPSL